MLGGEELAVLGHAAAIVDLTKGFSQCRCQKYHFGKLKESEIMTRLQGLAEKEHLDIDEAALFLIASRAEGSLRDAEMMLDQLSLLDQTITLAMVQELVRRNNSQLYDYHGLK